MKLKLRDTSSLVGIFTSVALLAALSLPVAAQNKYILKANQMFLPIYTDSGAPALITGTGDFTLTGIPTSATLQLINGGFTANGIESLGGSGFWGPGNNSETTIGDTEYGPGEIIDLFFSRAIYIESIDYANTGETGNDLRLIIMQGSALVEYSFGSGRDTMLPGGGGSGGTYTFATPIYLDAGETMRMTAAPGSSPDSGFFGNVVVVVPEPSSFALLGLGVLGSVIRRKR
jgi:PEP-CTERM motif